MQENIDDILMKRLSGEPLSREEEACFDEWMERPEQRAYYMDLSRIRSRVMASSVKERIDREKAWNVVRPKRVKRAISVVMKYAAVVALPFGIAFFFLLKDGQEEQLAYIPAEVAPGKKIATLTLASGEQVVLSDSLLQMREGSVVISNSSEKELKYSQETDSVVTTVAYNAVNVPRGGEYKLTLADGTIVWLNSDSYLRYPLSFGSERQVELRGEAYFEVAKNSEKPFVVKMNEYDVRVTGTQFNVKNYSDENTATTLVEGSVQVEKKGMVRKMVPGQQAMLVNGSFQIEKVNVEDQIAWRYGAFAFTQCRLENIMEELARWYDIDVFYMNQQVKNYHFSAWFKRSSSINDVISILEKTKRISLDIKGRILTVKDISRN